ncbi:hypothetical protein WN51_08927 [Melipona quadrifasciata]|uniref:Uncharacterized protein n=1 Tax=Melipona quadrifasciata TaxID=166423 RepID=A0A0M8ZQH9_9HYME|nr:hypothetical protein WN51_08927 [Melipona quadrifasciata]
MSLDDTIPSRNRVQTTWQKMEDAEKLDVQNFSDPKRRGDRMAGQEVGECEKGFTVNNMIWEIGIRQKGELLDDRKQFKDRHRKESRVVIKLNVVEKKITQVGYSNNELLFGHLDLGYNEIDLNQTSDVTVKKDGQNPGKRLYISDKMLTILLSSDGSISQASSKLHELLLAPTCMYNSTTSFKGLLTQTVRVLSETENSQHLGRVTSFASLGTGHPLDNYGDIRGEGSFPATREQYNLESLKFLKSSNKINNQQLIILPSRYQNKASRNMYVGNRMKAEDGRVSMQRQMGTLDLNYRREKSQRLTVHKDDKFRDDTKIIPRTYSSNCQALDVLLICSGNLFPELFSY